MWEGGFSTPLFSEAIREQFGTIHSHTMHADREEEGGGGLL